MDDIARKYQELREREQGIRARDAAARLGISEAELVAAQETTTRLVDEPQAILEAMESLGRVMALTRNDYCVHERKGVYTGGGFSEGPMRMGMFVGPDIDLRLFMAHWRYCFAVRGDGGGRKSLQFFDGAGVAVHKIHLLADSDEDAFDALVERFEGEAKPVTPEPASPPPAPKPDSEVDWADFRKSWEGMRDTLELTGILRKFGVGKVQAFGNIGDDFARKVSNNAVSQLLKLVAGAKFNIMVFVGNRGCIQIHSGRVKNLVAKAPWFNVMDPDFNLHLDESGIDSCWVVRKPTANGIITSLEAFAADGEAIVTFFSKRKMGSGESEDWREMLNEI